MRPITIRHLTFTVAVFSATACTGDVTTSPKLPTSAAFALSETHGQDAAQLPLRGTITTADHAVIVPPNLLAQGTGGGLATLLGRFTVTFSAVAPLGSNTATGTYTFTAANGDQLVATFAGNAVDLAPGVVSFTEVATIVSGTGRFAGATGSFTLRRVGYIDYVTATSTASGSFEGVIHLSN